MSFVHDPRRLDKEMDEAAEAAAQVTGIEKNPLLLILYRLSHQDKQLEMIRIQMDSIGMKLYDHIAKSEEVKDAIDDMVVIWRGSRIMGKVIMWFISLASALAAGWVAAKKLILF